MVPFLPQATLLQFFRRRGIFSGLLRSISTLIILILLISCTTRPSATSKNPVEPAQSTPLTSITPAEDLPTIKPTTQIFEPLTIEAALDFKPDSQTEKERLATSPKYTLAIRIDYANHSYHATSSVNFTNNETTSLDRLYFRLYPNGGKSYGNGKLVVDEVRVGNNILKTNLSQEDTVLETLLPAPLPIGDQIFVEFDFHGKVPVASSQLTGIENAGYGIFSFFDGVMTLSGWFPILAVYDEDGWNLDPVYSFGDSVFSDGAAYDVSITAPSELVIAASGLEIETVLAENQTRKRFISGFGRDFALIMSPEFSVQTSEVDGIKVNSYTLPGHAQGSAQALEITTNAIRLFNQVYGPYPFAELDVVEAPMNYALGVEFPEIFLVNRDLYNTPLAASFATTVSHETAHQWWYNLVGNDVIEEPWLDEGLATFSSGLYFEEIQGTPAGQGYTEYLQTRYQENLDRGVDGPIDETLAYYEQSGDPRLYSHSVYVKAGLMFTDLRKQIGDEAFFQGLQSYFQQNIYEIGTREEIRSAFEAASGQSLESFFQGYSLQPEPPAPQAPVESSISFAVIGDYGSGDKNARSVAELVKSWQLDFIITVGDNNYPTGSAETIDYNIGQFYAEFISPYVGAFGPGGAKNLFFPTLGNHDWDSDGAQPYFNYFSLPGNERYYDFRWGPVHFFALDGDWREPDGVGSSSTQAQWLKEHLAASDAPWKVVYGHHPPYTSGYQGPVKWMRWPFKEWGADIYLAGHDHDYERLEVDGFPYIVNGLGGGAIYSFEKPIPGSLVRYNDGYGAILVTADEKQITFQFITVTGKIIDTFTLRK